MFTQHDVTNDELDRLSALLHVEADILGARRRPLPMALAAVVSALIVLATAPLTSVLAFSTVAFFLVFSAYLVLRTDGELARSGADHFADKLG